MRLTQTEGEFALSLELYAVGQDLLAVLQGGRAHLGCAVLAVPRPSLADPEQIGCTSSVLNRVGHKDEVLCRRFAEELCVHTGRATVCTGGLHWDHLSEQQFHRVSQAAEQLLRQALPQCPKREKGGETAENFLRG